MMETTNKKSVPAHYATSSGVLRKIVFGYLKGLDSVVGLMAASIVWGIGFMALWSLVQAFVRFPFGQAAAEQVVPWVFVVFAPLVIRLGLSVAGFEMPSVFGRKSRSRDSAPRK